MANGLSSPKTRRERGEPAVGFRCKFRCASSADYCTLFWQQPQTPGLPDSLSAIIRLKAPEQVLQVLLDGTLCQSESVSYAFIGHPFGKQGKNLQLPGR